jgi:hypothetical protein
MGMKKSSLAHCAAIAVIGATGLDRVEPLAHRQGSAGIERIDYLTFAHGAVPVAIGGASATFPSSSAADYSDAIRAIDGSPQNFSMIGQAPADADTEFVYKLPAVTTFDRFAVPEILETPSPTQTFVRRVEVSGSTTSATAGFEPLASGVLQTHKTRGLVTELTLAAKRPVRRIKVRLVGGINVMAERSSFEFSEIIGNGTQATPELDTRFTGAWRSNAPRVQLRQNGAVVAGCFDGSGQLAGTVTGSVLRATGSTRSAGIPVSFILSIGEDGSLRGVRSDNRGPFMFTSMAPAPASTALECGLTGPPALGCGSVIHGINFAFDSAEIRPESEPVLAELANGLSAETRAKIVIEGHTSSEGTDEYNLKLSERRSQAVVADLVKRGIAASRLSAIGRGESQPIATNADESGRAMNRRVEIECQ